MDAMKIATIVLVSSMFLSVILFVILKVSLRRSQRNGTQEIYKTYEQLNGSGKSKRKQQVRQILQDSYIAYNKVPLLRAYIQKIRRRLQAIHSYDELTMRRETMKIVFYTLGIMAAVILVLLFMNNDLTFIFMLLLTALIVNGLLIDTFVHRVEDRLLIQLRDLWKDTRHHFHQHGMIDEALHDTSESTSYEASLHAKKIHDVLVSNNPEDSLASYYEKAPNRFLKAFAGMSYLVKEFGDKIVKNGSLYLNNLNKLTEELNLEIMKRSRLNYLFKGLTAIAVIPIIFTKPIEVWARQNFPDMVEFYTSKWGFILKIVIFSVILISYFLLKKMQDQQEGTYVAKTKKIHWENFILRLPGVEWFIDRLEPQKRTLGHFKISRLLKDANAGIPMNWHYLHRLLLSVALSVGLLISIITMHSITVKNVMDAPTKNNAMFGKMSSEELQVAQSTTAFDKEILYQLKGVNKDDLHNQVVLLIKQDSQVATNDTLLNDATQRILTKFETINSEYFKWWELLICLLMGWVGYQIPYWILLFQKRVRAMDMQNEVDQFHTIIAMLSEFDRVSVEVILEWMERFSSIFKSPLHACVLNYESGAEEALEQLKLDAPFTPLVRIVEKLQLSVERIPIKQAFDDLETERTYYFDQRKEDYERIIEQKASWGRLIGFAPFYALVFLYLVIPFLIMSFTQMSTYYEQLQKL